MASAGLLSAADPRLMNLVMPDARVMAGINVEQAKTTPFGQYLLSQMQANSSGMDQLAAATGFDPTRDVREFLVASKGEAGGQTGLALATGQFDTAKIAAFAGMAGVKANNYKGVTLYQKDDRSAVAFLAADIVMAGDLASVQGAIDRRGSTRYSVDPALAVKVSSLSATQDAWVVSMVPPSNFHPAGPSGPVQGAMGANAFQKIDQGSAGVKFGADVVVTAQAVAQTAADATAMADVIRFLSNMVQLQGGKDPNAAAIAQGLKVAASGQNLNLSVSVPEAQFEQLTKPKPHGRTSPRRK